MSLKNIDNTPNHNRFKKDVEKLLNKYTGKLSTQEMLAQSAKITGMLVALQDQTRMTEEQALEIVVTNVQLGNVQMIRELNKHLN